MCIHVFAGHASLYIYVYMIIPFGVESRPITVPTRERNGVFKKSRSLYCNQALDINDITFRSNIHLWIWYESNPVGLNYIRFMWADASVIKATRFVFVINNCIFLKENARILIYILLTFVPKGKCKTTSILTRSCWIETEKVTSHYLSQWWPSSLRSWCVNNLTHTSNKHIWVDKLISETFSLIFV